MKFTIFETHQNQCISLPVKISPEKFILSTNMLQHLEVTSCDRCNKSPAPLNSENH